MADFTDALLTAIEERVRKVVREELGRTGPEVMSTAEAARFASACGHPVTAKTVLDWINEGVGGRKLPAGKRGRHRTIRREDLEKFLVGERDAPASGSIQAVAASLRRAG
jgi:hypothetical protein